MLKPIKKKNETDAQFKVRMKAYEKAVKDAEDAELVDDEDAEVASVQLLVAYTCPNPECGEEIQDDDQPEDGYSLNEENDRKVVIASEVGECDACGTKVKKPKVTIEGA